MDGIFDVCKLETAIRDFLFFFDLHIFAAAKEDISSDCLDEEGVVCDQGTNESLKITDKETEEDDAAFSILNSRGLLVFAQLGRVPHSKSRSGSHFIYWDEITAVPLPSQKCLAKSTPDIPSTICASSTSLVAMAQNEAQRSVSFNVLEESSVGLCNLTY